jgi:hypothetical protein
MKLYFLLLHVTQLTRNSTAVPNETPETEVNMILSESLLLSNIT